MHTDAVRTTEREVPTMPKRAPDPRSVYVNRLLDIAQDVETSMKDGGYGPDVDLDTAIGNVYTAGMDMPRATMAAHALRKELETFVPAADLPTLEVENGTDD